MLPNRSSVCKHIEFNHIDILQRPISRGNSPCNFFGFANLLDCEVGLRKSPDSCPKPDDFISVAGDHLKTALAPTVNPYSSREMVEFRTGKVVEIVRAMKAKEINPYPR
jgi:hypothetical protein